MTQQDLIAQVAQSTPSKIIFLVIDGLGGLPHPDTGKSELETAYTPNLDRLAARAMCGLTGSGIARIESGGRTNLPVATLLKLSHGIGISIEELAAASQQAEAAKLDAAIGGILKELGYGG